MTTQADLHALFAGGLDSAARVRVRRPRSLFQVELPAFMEDGDAAQVYVRADPGGQLRVTDLGSTRMRLSYEREPTPEMYAELGALAAMQGLTFERGELGIDVSPNELVPAALALLQVEAQADRIEPAARRRKKEVRLAGEFREAVNQLLQSLFAGNVEAPFFDKVADAEGLYALSALVHAPCPLVIAIIPGDLEAERAVAAKLWLAGRKVVPAKTRFVAVPRDFERLTSKTRTRVVREFIPLGSFDGNRAQVEERLLDLAGNG